jgi:hypothetical protein
LDLTRISPLLAALSCLAGALAGLLIFALTHALFSVYFPSSQTHRQRRPNQRLTAQEVWAGFTAEADAIADADAEEPAPELEPDAGINPDLGLEEIAPIGAVLRTGNGGEVIVTGLGRAGERPLGFGMADVGRAGVDENESIQRQIWEMMLRELELEAERERRPRLCSLVLNASVRVAQEYSRYRN